MALSDQPFVGSFWDQHHRITAQELSVEAGITERAIRTIIADLEEAGSLPDSERDEQPGTI